jgi:hypothetical protein
MIVKQKKIIEHNAPCFIVIKSWVKEYRDNFIKGRYDSNFIYKDFPLDSNQMPYNGYEQSYNYHSYLYNYHRDLVYIFLNLPHIIDLLDFETLNIKNDIDLDPEIKLVVNGFDFKYKLLYLCHNPNAIKIIERHIDILDENNWRRLCLNINAIDLLEQHLDKVQWIRLCENPAAIKILEQNLDKFPFNWLSCNPAAIHLLEQNLDKVDWEMLCFNQAAIHLLEQNLDKIKWSILSGNPAAIHLLKQNPDKIDWNCCIRWNYNWFKLNNNNYIFIKEPCYLFDELLFDVIKHNVLLNNYPHKLYQSRGIFTYDFDKIRQIRARINKEIMEESNKRLYKPSLFLNPNSSDLEKEMSDYINIYE